MSYNTKSQYSFHDLFVVYSKFGNWDSNRKRITLLQSDKWMKTAGLFSQTKLSLTDTLEAFVKFKAESLNYLSYKEFLKNICRVKRLDLQEVRNKLEFAGLPEWRSCEEMLNIQIPLKRRKRKKGKAEDYYLLCGE